MRETEKEKSEDKCECCGNDSNEASRPHTNNGKEERFLINSLFGQTEKEKCACT